jgi:hypothetical protein
MFPSNGQKPTHAAKEQIRKRLKHESSVLFYDEHGMDRPRFHMILTDEDGMNIEKKT